jgi:hypothetical protein
MVKGRDRLLSWPTLYPCQLNVDMTFGFTKGHGATSCFLRVENWVSGGCLVVASYRHAVSILLAYWAFSLIWDHKTCRCNKRTRFAA